LMNCDEYFFRLTVHCTDCMTCGMLKCRKATAI